nr:hypothetical protein [Tanacetum cinerariifolium]
LKGIKEEDDVPLVNGSLMRVFGGVRELGLLEVVMEEEVVMDERRLRKMRMSMYHNLVGPRYATYDRVMLPLATQKPHKPRKDIGIKRACHSTSSSSSFHHGSSSRQNDDDDELRDEENYSKKWEKEYFDEKYLHHVTHHHRRFDEKMNHDERKRRKKWSDKLS